jgi:hypothetical protein
VRIGIRRPARPWRRYHQKIQVWPQGANNGGRNLFLYLEYILEFPVVALRPQVSVRASVY